MAAPPSEAKAGVLSTLRGAREQLLAAINGLPPDEMTVPVDEGWSVKDMLTHITSWEELILLDLHRLKKGRTPANYCRGTDEWNEMLMNERTGFSLEQILTEFAEMRDEVMRTLRDIPDDRFAQGDVPGACQILAIHDWQHTSDIKSWRERGD